MKLDSGELKQVQTSTKALKLYKSEVHNRPTRPTKFLTDWQHMLTFVGIKVSKNKSTNANLFDPISEVV